MGVRRYSRDPAVERRERYFEYLQARCRGYSFVKVADLRQAGVVMASWHCRECLHEGPLFPVWGLPHDIEVGRMNDRLVCSSCGAKRPYLKLSQEGYRL